MHRQIFIIGMLRFISYWEANSVKKMICAIWQNILSSATVQTACTSVLITLLNAKGPNQMFRWAVRVGVYDWSNVCLRMVRWFFSGFSSFCPSLMNDRLDISEVFLEKTQIKTQIKKINNIIVPAFLLHMRPTVQMKNTLSPELLVLCVQQGFGVCTDSIWILLTLMSHRESPEKTAWMGTGWTGFSFIFALALFPTKDVEL